MYKVFTLEEMAVISKQIKADGKTVVLAHGTFDLLHIGHIRYLQYAKSLGSRLIVSITADKFVNKGPGKPVFPEGLRADALVALSCVDYVTIVPAPDGVAAINIIKPDVYIKGSDYRYPEGDITGKIIAERAATEVHGGRLIIANTEQFSSTALINQYMNVYEPHLKAHLDGIRSNGGLTGMLDLIESISAMKVLVIGESITDIYRYVVPMGKSAKENIIATRYQDHESFIGGAEIIAMMLRNFCKETKYATWPRAIRKERFVDPNYMRKLFEVCYINDDPIMAHEEAEIISGIEEVLPYIDVIIVLDYGHGMISPRIVSLLAAQNKFLAVNTQMNSNNIGFNVIQKYPRADLVCIDANEARLAVRDRHAPMDGLLRQLSEVINCKKFIITNGKNGSATYDAETKSMHTVPAVPVNSVTDTIGTGDCFLGLAAPLVARGAPLAKAAFIGNVAGAAKTSILGHKRPVDKIDIVKALTGLLK